MKTSAVNNSRFNIQNRVSFKGHTAYTTPNGYTRHKFYLPFDDTKYDAKVELKYFTDKNGEWKPTEDKKITLNLPKSGLEIYDKDLLEGENVPGYRFVLSPKNNSNQKIYKLDSGVATNPNSSAHENYTILMPKRTVLSHNGLTKQVMPDLLPGYELRFDSRGDYKLLFDKPARERALNAVRNHGNKLGGNFAGIIKMLPTWKEEGYTKLVGTPFTKDEISSHLYWTENPYQVSSALGSLDEFKALQIELFKNGMNFIADGAFVNQGLQGTMFRNLLKHGTESPYFHWFNAPGLLDNGLELGAVPKNPEARKNFRFRLVNAPINIIDKNGKIVIEKNGLYDETKNTYLQLYDKRLVTAHELEDDTTLLKRYSITNTSNPYEITSHDDITQLLAFEINANNYAERAKRVLKSVPSDERTFQNTSLVESLLSFPNYKITTKDKGGVNLWDGNMDIAKLRFYVSNTDNIFLSRYENESDRKRELSRMNKAEYQVKDFTLGAGKYWTKLVADTQLEYIAKTLEKTEPTPNAYKKAIAKAVEKGAFPESVKELMTDTVIKNVVSGKYKFEKTQKDKFGADHWLTGYLRQRVADFPLESLEFSTDLNGVIASPFISKRATNEKELNLTRIDIYERNRKSPARIDKEYAGPYQEMDDLILNEMSELVEKILVNMNDNIAYEDNSKLMFTKQGRLTEFGKYVIPLILPDIMKFVMVKGFNPEANITMNAQTGIINYSQANVSDISLKTLGIDGTPRSEATAVVRKLRKGIIKALKSDEYVSVAETLKTRVSKLSLVNLRMAEAIMDQTESGLGWRIDAAKDIADIDAVRTRNDNDELLLHEVSDFWKRFNDAVKSQNKHAYTTAEITDLGSIISTHGGVYKNYVNAETKFIERSGLNNTANYMFFYSMLRNLFSKDAEKGGFDNFNNINELYDKLVVGWPKDDSNNKICNGFLFQYPSDSIINSYTFVGNHDKPRVLGVFALDMDLFHSDFTNQEHRETAKWVLNLESIEDLDVYTLSAKAIAMGTRIKDALQDTKILDKNSRAFNKAIADLSSGIYKGQKFDAEAFGTRDFRHAIKDVFDVAKLYGYESDNVQKDMDLVLENILTPAMDKMETVYKMLVTLPGSPTDFVGDKEGSSGYETKSNNNFQQNRNVVPFEWVSDTINNDDFKQFNQNKGFVNNYYRNMTEIGKLRTIKELSALRSGETVALPMQTARDGSPVAATFRYDDKGSQVICLYTTSGANADVRQKMNRYTVNLDKLVLDNPNNWKVGIKGGLKPGDIFKKVGCDSEYQVFDENGQYVLRRINSSEFFDISILEKDKNTAIFYKVNPKAYKVIPANLYYEGMI